MRADYCNMENIQKLNASRGASKEGREPTVATESTPYRGVSVDPATQKLYDTVQMTDIGERVALLLSKIGHDDEITIWVDREGIGMHQDGLCSAKELKEMLSEIEMCRDEFSRFRDVAQQQIAALQSQVEELRLDKRAIDEGREQAYKEMYRQIEKCGLLEQQVERLHSELEEARGAE